MPDYPIVSHNAARQAFYVAMRDKGEPHKFAEMCANQRPPACKTDREFLASHGTLENQFAGDPRGLREATTRAMANGYKPSPNDTYIPTLARFPGDPMAFVPASDPRGHCRRVAEARGHGLEDDEGRTIVPSPDPVMPKQVKLDVDLVEEERGMRIQQNPDLAHTNQDDLRRQIVDDHGVQN
jgi:hypothetical protein